MTTSTSLSYLGVDVCKAHLDVAGAEQRHRLANEPKAIAAWLKTLPRGAHLIVEATGGYERSLVRACHQHSLAVSVVNPARVRHFAKADGRLAKTDALDADVLRQFGYAFAPPADPAVDPRRQKLAELVKARDQFVDLCTQLSNAREHGHSTLVGRLYDAALRSLHKHIAKLEAAIAASLQDDPRAQALSAHHGVGLLTTATLLALLPELGQANRNQIGALAGLAPYNEDSGNSNAPRFIRGGRPRVRRALYMATLSAVRTNGPLANFYRHLRDRGKPAKVALIAAARKLLCLLNSSLKSLPN